MAEWLSSLPPTHFSAGVAGSSPAVEFYFPFLLFPFLFSFTLFKHLLEATDKEMLRMHRPISFISFIRFKNVYLWGIVDQTGSSSF